MPNQTVMFKSRKFRTLFLPCHFDGMTMTMYTVVGNSVCGALLWISTTGKFSENKHVVNKKCMVIVDKCFKS